MLVCIFIQTTIFGDQQAGISETADLEIKDGSHRSNSRVYREQYEKEKMSSEQQHVNKKKLEEDG